MEKTLESPLDCKEIQPVHPKGNQSWMFIGRTDVEAETSTLATWCEELTHLKRPWCWERLKVGEGDDRGWDGWMASPAQWTWVWVNSRSWRWTGRPGVLQSMGSQIRTQLSNWTELNFLMLKYQKWNPSFSLCPVSQLLPFLSLLDFKILAHSPFYTLYNLDPNSCSLWFTGHSVS